MKAFLCPLYIFGAFCAPSVYSLPREIQLEKQSYQIESIIKNDVKCGDYSKDLLQTDLSTDPLSVQVSTSYDIDKNLGYATADIVRNEFNFKLLSVNLKPLGLSNRFAFGDYNRPGWKLSVNKNEYLIYGIIFNTSGTSENQWAKNGSVSIIFTDLLGNVCTVQSKLTTSAL